MFYFVLWCDTEKTLCSLYCYFLISISENGFVLNNVFEDDVKLRHQNELFKIHDEIRDLAEDIKVKMDDLLRNFPLEHKEKVEISHLKMEIEKSQKKLERLHRQRKRWLNKSKKIRLSF